MVGAANVCGYVVMLMVPTNSCVVIVLFRFPWVYFIIEAGVSTWLCSECQCRGRCLERALKYVIGLTLSYIMIMPRVMYTEHR